MIRPGCFDDEQKERNRIMKRLPERIREILSKRRVRRFLTRVVSIIGALVVFATTYALVLPAITMEKQAACGIEEHQHDDSCFELQLICGEEESETHQHTDECYERVLVCEKPVHTHSTECYETFEETYEKPADTDAGTEEDTMSGQTAGTDSSETENGTEAAAADGIRDTDSTGASDENTDRDETGSEKADAKDIDPGRSGSTEDSDDSDKEFTENHKSSSSKVQADAVNPEDGTIEGESLDAAEVAVTEDKTYAGLQTTLDLAGVLSDRTGLYYYPAKYDEDGIADTTAIRSDSATDWEKVKDDTQLASADFVRVYLAYTIPAGTLNKDHYTARYRLPGALRLTENRVEAINKSKNGISKEMEASTEITRSSTDADFEEDFPTDEETWLGAEAIEGTRTPDRILDKAETEYISATVKVENIYKSGEYRGQDLIFTFTPYTVRKNQTTYNADGKTLAEGEKVRGFFSLDFNPDQISCDESGTAEILFAKESDVNDVASGQFAQKEIRRVLHLKDSQNSISGNGAIGEDATDTAAEAVNTDNTEQDRTEKKQTGKGNQTEENKDGTDAVTADQKDGLAAAEEKFLTGSVIAASGEAYEINVTYGEDAQIPDGSELRVREILESDSEYKDYSEQAVEKVEEVAAQIAEENADAGDNAAAKADSSTGNADGNNPDGQALPRKSNGYVRVFDIEIWHNGQKIEPEAEVLVEIRLLDAPENKETSLDVVHFAEDGPEVLSTDQNTNTRDTADTSIQFTTDAFSVYTIVGTEVITTEHISHDGTKYEVTVTYGPEAKIPEGSWLRVEDIEDGTDAYDYALNSVLADKKEKGESVDINDFNLAALDISIIDPDGNEIEPEATVQVDIKIKELPDVEMLDRVKNTIEVQHHVETDDGVVIDKVFEGVTEGTYSMDTDENIISKGTVVDPSSVSEEDFIVNDDVLAEEVEAEEPVTISFGTESFSTYTITWQGSGRGTSNSTATMRFRSNSTNHATVTVHFVDENGIAITRPGNDTFNASPNPSNNTTTSYNLENTTIFGNITGWSYVGTYRDSALAQPITEIQVGRGTAVSGNNIRSIAFFNGEEQIGDTVAVSSGTANGGDIYVVYRNGLNVTVHFVDRNGNELSGIKDPDGNTIDGSSLTLSTNGETIDLSAFTKDGYTYANTRLKEVTNTGTSLDDYRMVWPGFRYNNNNFQGTTDAIDENDASNQWYNRNYQNGDELYVVFDPVPTNGGGSGGGGDTPIADLPDPETSKTLTDNHDGTYDLNLSITGKSDTKEENKNINVLFVIDSSSSMGDINSSTSRIGKTKADVITSAETLLKNNTQANPNLVEVAAVSFDNKGYDVSGWTTSLDTFKTNINDTSKLTTHTGTNWEAGLRQALDFGTGDGDPTYVIFFTDGMPYGYIQSGYTDNYHGNVNSHYLDMAAANDEARALLNSGVTLYGIFAYGSTSDNNRDLLGRLIDYAYNDTTSRSTYYKTAADSDDVSEALAAIVDSITQAAGFTNVELTDGITGLTHTTLINGQAGGFTYYRSGGKDDDGNEKYDSTANGGRGEVWTTADGAPAASFSSATGVTWDLGNLILEDGVTYTVSFTVWPDQDAYDTVAEINNTEDPKAAYEALDPAIKSQIQFDESTGKCSLKTNTEAKAKYTSIKTSTEKKLPTGATSTGTNTWTYTDSTGKIWTYVKNEDGTYTGTTTQDKELTYDDVPAISLDKTTMKVKKIWVDNLTNAEDRPLSVDFTIYEDGVTYQTVHLTGEGQTWEAEINIAPGIYVTPGTHDTDSSGDSAGVMEGAEGHVYTIAETGYTYLDKNGNEVTVSGVENHYDFDTDPVKPMLNGTTTADETDMIEYLTKTTWSASEAALVATNTVKDGIYIYKKVTTDGTDEIDCDEQFTIKVTLKDSEGNPVYTTSQVSGDLAWRIDKEDASSSSGYTEESRGYYTSTDGTVTLTMDADGRIRIVNVPVGTTFTVEEVTTEGTMPMGYEYYSSQVNEEAVTTDNKATGTTVGNKQWATTITNKRNALSVDLLKVDNADTSKTLEGAEFSLFMADGTTPATDADGNAIGTIRSGTDGKVSIGTLLAGTYVLQETKAPDGYNLMSSNVTITVAADNVTAIQGTSQCTVTKSDDGLTYTITVTNSAGVELPMTGGPGTLLYTLGGLALILASALMYGFRMRRRERRLN